MTRSLLIRTMLSLTLLAGLSVIWADRLDELCYFFSTEALKDLGEAKAISDTTILPDNSYIRLKGNLGQSFAYLTGMRTGSFRWGPIQVSDLEKSSIFLEYDVQKYGSSFKPRFPIEVVGRLQNFSERSELRKVREYFKTVLKIDLPDSAMILIVDEKPGTDYRYPILFLLSLLAFAASIWAVLVGSVMNNI